MHDADIHDSSAGRSRTQPVVNVMPMSSIDARFQSEGGVGSYAAPTPLFASSTGGPLTFNGPVVSPLVAEPPLGRIVCDGQTGAHDADEALGAHSAL